MDTGGIWEDPRLPDLSDIFERHSELDPVALEAWLSDEMALYRMRTEDAGDDETPASARDHLNAIEDAARALREMLGVGQTGTLAFTRLHFAAKKTGANWQSLTAEAQRLLDDVERIATIAWCDMRGVKSKSGRKPTAARDHLLAGLVDLLAGMNIPRKAAPQLARDLLVRCGVPMPATSAATGDRALRKAAARAGQK